MFDPGQIHFIKKMLVFNINVIELKGKHILSINNLIVIFQTKIDP